MEDPPPPLRGARVPHTQREGGPRKAARGGERRGGGRQGQPSWVGGADGVMDHALYGARVSIRMCDGYPGTCPLHSITHWYHYWYEVYEVYKVCREYTDTQSTRRIGARVCVVWLYCVVLRGHTSCEAHRLPLIFLLLLFPAPSLSFSPPPTPFRIYRFRSMASSTRPTTTGNVLGSS